MEYGNFVYMKGRMRKAKKAFKNHRHGKMFNRYVKFVIDRKHRALYALKMMQVAMVARMGVLQVQKIRASQTDKATKALAIAEQVINTQLATAKILSTQL
jgi:hypothetical protein